MQIEALAVRLRPRTALEAADLGVRLSQSAARSIYPCHALAALPVMAVAVAASDIAVWVPQLIIWCAKPWIDRTILFVLSRAAFGQRTTPADVWRSQRQVWWSQLLFTCTIQRLSLWRSLTQPVYQLEGLPIFRAGARIRQIRRRTAGSGFVVTSVYALAELALELGLLSLVFWFSPSGNPTSMFDVIFGEPPRVFVAAMSVTYAAIVFFLEPFYVAAGFAMYLNRRADLEAWDIEQEFRRAFAA